MGGDDPQTLGCQILLVWWTPSSWGAGLCHRGGWGGHLLPPGGGTQVSSPTFLHPNPGGPAGHAAPAALLWGGGEPPQTPGSPEGEDSAGHTHTHAWAHVQLVAHALADTNVCAHPVHAHTAACTHKCSSAHTRTRRRAHTQTCVQAHTCVDTHARMPAGTCIHPHACTHTCTPAHAGVCTHVHLDTCPQTFACWHTQVCTQTHVCMHTPLHAHPPTHLCMHTHAPGGAVGALTPHPSPRPDVLILFVPKAA